MERELLGKHVVVTGATGELGGAVLDALVAAGATVHAPVRRAPEGLDPDRVRVTAGIDLADEAAVDAYYAGLPPPWASIHAAGAYAPGAIDETDRAALERMLSINLASALSCGRAAVRAMRRGPGGGRIVNVAALPALEPRRGAGSIAYTASKAALAAVTIALGEELAGDGILVNAVAPSTMDTPANRRALPGADPSRWATVAEVAATVAFLASPRNRVTRSAVVPVYGRS
jgi:NAD(P)-dependent dehydrogenase (short-subunit alcohol dehydrogenase family)